MRSSDTPESEFDLAEHFPESVAEPDWSKETASDDLLSHDALEMIRVAADTAEGRRDERG